MAGIEILKEKVIIILETSSNESNQVLMYDKGELTNIVLHYSNIIGSPFNFLDIKLEEKTRCKIEFSDLFNVHDYTVNDKKLNLIIWKIK